MQSGRSLIYLRGIGAWREQVHSLENILDTMHPQLILKNILWLLQVVTLLVLELYNDDSDYTN